MSAAPTIDALLKAGLAHQRAGRPDKAEAAYKQVLKAKPGHPDALHLLGVLASAAGKPKIAIELIGKAVAAVPGNAAYRHTLGQVLLAAGKPNEAAEAFRRVIEIDPEHPEAYNSLCGALKRLGDFDEAVAIGQRAVEKRPGYAPAHHNLGDVLKAVGRRDEAMAAFRKAIAMKPRFAEAHCSLGLALNEEGEPDAAVACFKKAIGYSPRLSSAHVMLGNVLQEQSKPAEAVACYRKALEIEPGNEAAHNNLDIARAFVGEPAATARRWRQAVEEKPEDVAARRKLAGALWELGETGDALAELDEALTLAPDDGDVHYAMALIRDSRGEREAALDALRRAYTLDPGNVFARGLEASMAAPKADTTGAKRVALYMQQRYHYNILRPAFEALRGRQVVAMVSEVQQLVEFAPDVVVLADTHAALLRARLPDAVFVWVRHGLISKNITRYGARIADYACMTSEVGRDWYIDSGVRPRRDWWITGYLQMDPLFNDAPLPLPIDMPAARKCVLYAPTWTTGLSSAAMLGDRLVHLIRDQRDDITIVIKPHPVAFHQQPATIEAWRALADGDPNVHLVDDASADVMPWLKAADVLVSDASSVIFQYLAVDRPMVLISNPARFTSPHFDQRGIEWLWRDVGEEVHHVDNLAAAVSRGLDDPTLGADRRAHYRWELFGDLTDGRAAERLANHIDELVL